MFESGRGKKFVTEHEALEFLSRCDKTGRSFIELGRAISQARKLSGFFGLGQFFLRQPNDIPTWQLAVASVGTGRMTSTLCRSSNPFYEQLEDVYKRN